LKKSAHSILVTGADGFIGSHLVEHLFNFYGGNIAIRALSQYNSFNFWGWLEDLPMISDIEVVTGDIRDPEVCRKITRGIDVVYNLAALIAIPYSYDAPSSYIDTNVKGTQHLCSAALENNCRKFIHTSTSEVYGTARYVPIDENHPLQPQSPYSASKIGADHIAMSYYHAFNLPVAIARPFNTFGPRQSARAVIPTIITQVASGSGKVSLGDVRPTRDMNYVADTCAAIRAIGESDKTTGQVVNIGSGKEISIKDLFVKICALMHKECELIRDESRTRPPDSEVMRLLCDHSRLDKLTGFTPEYTLGDGLIKTIDWFTEPANLRKYKVDLYNL
jgi:NAD dependent epimerase/dehydratase